MRNKRRLAVAGILSGAVAAVSPGTIFILFLTAVCALVLRRCARPQDRRFLVGLFLAAFFLRMAVSLGLDLASVAVERSWPRRLGAPQGWELNLEDRTRAFLNLGDSDFYSNRAYTLSQYQKGSREIVIVMGVKKPRPHSYLYVMASFYSFFGYSPISVKFINCLIGALLAPLVFFLAGSFFDRRVAVTSSVLAAFFPSLVLWSATNLKDPSFISLTALLFLLVIRIQQARSLRQAIPPLLLSAPVLIAHMTLRSDPGFSWALIGCAVASFTLSRLSRGWRVAALAAALGGVAAQWPRVYEKLCFAFYRHWGNVDAISTPNTATYRYLPDYFYNGDSATSMERLGKDIADLSVSILRAVGHFMVEPTPGRTGSSLISVVYPQMIVWYALLPFAIIGAGWGLRRRFMQSSFLLLTLFVWIIICALAAGNVGLVFRVRDMTTPFLSIFACVGVWAWLGRRAEAEG